MGLSLNLVFVIRVMLIVLVLDILVNTKVNNVNAEISFRIMWLVGINKLKFYLFVIHRIDFFMFCKHI